MPSGLGILRSCDMRCLVSHPINDQRTPHLPWVVLYLFRFSPDMHLPGDIIIKLLNLETECYEPHCPPAHEEFPKPFMFNYTAPLSRVVDPGEPCFPSHAPQNRAKDAGQGGCRGLV